MSRIGKKPIATPSGVAVTVSGQEVSVKGPKGTLSFRAPDELAVKHDKGEIVITPRSESKRARAMWGMARAILANQVKGVTEGFERTLELTGVGYRAALEGKNLSLSVGYSHPIVYAPPAGVTLAAPRPVEIKISGPDKQVVGQAAAEIRGFRPPEPYKGKGVKYAGERIRRKEGKKK
jgi:large subunit ribosomal protein L6